MRISRLFFLTCGLLLLFSPALRGQTELNVCLKPGAVQSLELLRALDGRAPADWPAMRTALPWAQSLQGVQSLTGPGRAHKGPAALQHIFTLQFAGATSDSLISALLATGEFVYVEPNRLRQLDAFCRADSSLDPDTGEQYYHELIRTFEAWDSTRGSANIRIGILDTGLDYDHPEFEGQIALNTAEDINGNGTFEPWPDTVTVGGLSGDFDGLDNDGNGFADDVIGYDFTDQPRSPFGGDYLFTDADPFDDNNHGTLVAGIAAAKADNNFGGTGIAPGCRIVVIRAFAASGAGEDDDIARGIIYAADNGVQVLNFSFGDIYPSRTMQAAVEYAYAKGVVMIGSAGNGTGDSPHFPSDFPEVISISATMLGSDGTSEFLWPLSSFGVNVDLAAPGSGIYAPLVQDTALESPFDFFSGTSTSAPMVSAAAGLILSLRPDCGPEEVRGILTGSADDVSDEGWDHKTGAGRLNILRALQTIGSSRVTIESPVNDGGTAQDTVYVTGYAIDPQFQAWNLDYEFGVEGAENWIPILSGGSTQVQDDTLALWDVSGLPEGEYTLRLQVERSNGSTLEDRIRFTIDRSSPLIDLRLAAPVWDNAERKMLFVFRNSDKGLTRIHFREVGSPDFQVRTFDRDTRNGSFLLGLESIGSGDYEYYLSCENTAGMLGVSPLDTFTYNPDFISLTGFYPTGDSLPMGHYLPTAYDLDNDGMKEVVMSRFDENLSFGRLCWYEYSPIGFQLMDSLNTRPILIPKDIQDVDGDGLMELLSSVNDSVYVTEQATASDFAKMVTYSQFTDERFPSEWADTDGDGALELLQKDFEDYYVYERSGNSYVQAAKLTDDTPDFFGSIAPRSLTDDFDGDGRPETIFGDYDGDFLIYEYDGSGYVRSFADTSNLEKAGTYLVKGDFDNDGQPEFFVAAHSSLLRDEADFEYLPGYWRLRIYDSDGNDSYPVVYEDYLFDIDTDGFNAATGGNLDDMPGDEILFSTFPRTYIIGYDGAEYNMRWFRYGDLCTRHAIGDFDGNGVNEFVLGDGLAGRLYEFDFNYAGPVAVDFPDGKVTGTNSTRIWWPASPNATEYRIWRGQITGTGSVQISPIDSTTALSYDDSNGLISGEDYLYVIQAKNPGLSPMYGDYSLPIVLRPHALNRLTACVPLDRQTLRVSFSNPVAPSEGDLQSFSVNGFADGESLIPAADPGNSVILHVHVPLNDTTHLLRVDSLFLDAFRAPIEPGFDTLSFVYNLEDSAYIILSNWAIVNDKQADLYYTEAVDASALLPANYRVYPEGSVVAVEWADAAHTGVRLRVDPVNFGALGYPVSIQVSGVRAESGKYIHPKTGNTATFSAFGEDLSGVYVYPNPYRAHSQFEGVRFANLTRDAEVQVYSASGRLVAVLAESDGDGGVEWNLLDTGGKRVKPGVFIYKVSNSSGEEVLGQFVVDE